MSVDPNNPSGHDFYPDIIPVHGAFEMYEGTREELITLTQSGRLLQPGDNIAGLLVDMGVGFDTRDTPFVVHSVNAFGTETCDKCVDEVEAFQDAHPGVAVYSLTKQTAEEIAAEDAKRAEAGKLPVTHRRITVSQQHAIGLGIALAPGENADPDFWPTALRRTLALVSPDGGVLSIQQPDDQEEAPDIAKLYETFEAEVTKDFHATRQNDHRSKLFKLATQSPDAAKPTSHEGLVDNADRNYSLLHNAGKLDEPFEWPSVAAARMQREAAQENRPIQLRSAHWNDEQLAEAQDEIQAFSDPEQTLAGMSVGTVAILEVVSDNDALDGSLTQTWLLPNDLADARRYLQQAGEYTSVPGPGEEDGVYTSRQIWVKEAVDKIVKARAYGG